MLTTATFASLVLTMQGRHDGGGTLAKRGSRVIAGEAWLEDGVDEGDALVEGGEGALHRVDREPLQVGPAVAELPGKQGELVTQGDLRHQAVVGVDGDTELELP